MRYKNKEFFVDKWSLLCVILINYIENYKNIYYEFPLKMKFY